MSIFDYIKSQFPELSGEELDDIFFSLLEKGIVDERFNLTPLGEEVANLLEENSSLN